MAAIDDAIDAHRAALAARDAVTSLNIARAHLAAKRELLRSIGLVLARIELAVNSGEIVNVDWLRRLDEMRALARQLDVVYRGYMANVYRVIAADREWAARFGVTSAEAMIGAQDPSVLVRLTRPAVNEIVGAATGDGSPLVAVLNRLAGAAATDVADILATGVVLGWSPNRTASVAARRLGVDLHRARLIARTETLRAYRSASLATYRQHGDVVQEWVWHASLDGRSCACCWALHGRRFSTSEPMGTHPNCRCAMVPVVRFGPEVGSGPELFAGLDEGLQRRVLGPAAYRAYREGAVRLEDLVAERVTGDWGVTRSARSLRSALGVDGAKRYYRPA